MIFGDFDISHRVLHTHNDSYALSEGTTVSARRPFLGTSLLLAAMLGAFGLAFRDLLYPFEIGVITAHIVGVLLVGINFGQLVLINRELRGSEYATALWGTYRTLNHVRRELADEIAKLRTADIPQAVSANPRNLHGGQ